jgi:hypothetical protein
MVLGGPLKVLVKKPQLVDHKRPPVTGVPLTTTAMSQALPFWLPTTTRYAPLPLPTSERV